MNKDLKIKQIGDIIASIEKTVNPDILIDIQRALIKAVEYTESIPADKFKGVMGAKRSNKDDVIAEFKDALEKNKQAHYLLLGVFDRVASIKYSL